MLAEIALGPDDSGRRVAATLDDTLVVRLQDTPMGYLWTVEPEPAAFSIVDSRLEPPPGEAIGAATTQVIELRPLSGGTHPLELALRRPWEPEADPVERLSLTVDVADA